MAEHVPDRHRVKHPGEQGPGRVAKVVEAQTRHACRITSCEVTAPKRGWVEAVAGDAGEHVVVIASEVGAPREVVERRKGLLAKRDEPRAATLGRSLDGGREGAFDDEHALRPTNIAPAERYELPAPESCVGGDPQQLSQLMVLLRAQSTIGAGGVGRIPPGARFRRTRQRLDLLDGEDVEPRRAVLPALGRGRGRVAGQAPALDVLAPEPEVEDRRNDLAVLVDASRADVLLGVRGQKRLDCEAVTSAAAMSPRAAMIRPMVLPGPRR